MPLIPAVVVLPLVLNVAITVQFDDGIVKLVGVVDPVRPHVPDQPVNVLPPLAVAAALTVEPSR